MKKMIGVVVMAAFITVSWLASAIAGPHCCPIIVQDVKDFIKPEQLVSNATFHVAVPILGKSTHRTRGHPSVVMMSVHLPSNYDPKRAHPVVVHLGGGVDQRKFIGRWQSITGNKDWIVLLAEYTSRLDSGPRNAVQMLRILEAATPIKHGAVILAGISSGSWGMNTNFADQFYLRGFMDPWDGFIFIAGNNNGGVTVTAEKLQGRPALFVGGNCGGAYAVQKKSAEEINAAGGKATFIDMTAGYQDFPGWCDPKIMEWITSNLVAKLPQQEVYEKKVAAIEDPRRPAAEKADLYLKALAAPVYNWFAKSQCVTKYLELCKAETDEAKRKDMIDKLQAIPNLPRTSGGPFQDMCVWLKDQPAGNQLALYLALHNPFVNPVVDPPKSTPDHNGYGPDVDFRAR